MNRTFLSETKLEAEERSIHQRASRDKFDLWPTPSEGSFGESFPFTPPRVPPPPPRHQSQARPVLPGRERKEEICMGRAEQPILLAMELGAYLTEGERGERRVGSIGRIRKEEDSRLKSEAP